MKLTTPQSTFNICVPFKRDRLSKDDAIGTEFLNLNKMSHYGEEMEGNPVILQWKYFTPEILTGFLIYAAFLWFDWNRHTNRNQQQSLWKYVWNEHLLMILFLQNNFF